MTFVFGGGNQFLEINSRVFDYNHVNGFFTFSSTIVVNSSSADG